MVKKPRAKRRLAAAFTEDSDEGTESHDVAGEGSDEDDEFDVEKILEERDGSFLVRWAGYESSENTWEPESNLPVSMVRSFRRKKKRTEAALPTTHTPPTEQTSQQLALPIQTELQEGPISEATPSNIPNNADETTPDDQYGVGTRVSFASSREAWMEASLFREVGSSFLVDVVARERPKKGTKGAKEYEIRWTSTQYQSKRHIHYVPYEKVVEGVSNYRRVHGSQLAPESWAALCNPYHESQLLPDILDDFDQIEEEYTRFVTDERLPQDLAEGERISAMEFQSNAVLERPSDLFVRTDGSTDTKLRPQYKAIFEHSASSSFFAYLPVSFWNKVVEETNIFGKALKQPKVTLEELFKFVGILFYMTLVDKGEYSNFWGRQVEDGLLNTDSAGLDTVMTKKRFQHIRANLSFRSDVERADLARDPAARIRPLLNMLKVRAPKFVDVGRNCAVDETSISCRSKYARHLIVYNATKPTGKYHFKVYMCCCSTTWPAVNFRLHCASEIGERLSGVIDAQATARLEAATRFSTEVRKLVIEATRPLHGSKRIINTDNFYTSCQLLESLKLFGLYCRGTIRENSKHYPRCFMIAKTDKLPRGTMKQGVRSTTTIVAASWVDGAVVNIVSNVDASTTTQVNRLVGREKVSYTAPECVTEYNQ